LGTFGITVGRQSGSQGLLFDTIDSHDNDPVPQYVEVDIKGVRVMIPERLGRPSWIRKPKNPNE